MTCSLLQRYLSVTTKLATAAEYISVVIFAVIVVLNFVAVVLRYVLSSPIGWSEEALRYAIVWAVYLIAATTFRDGEQMMIDLIDMIPFARIKQLAAILALGTTLMLAAVVVAFGLPYLFDTGQVSPSMRLPMWIPYSSVVIGYLMIAIQAVAGFIGNLLQEHRKDTQ